MRSVILDLFRSIGAVFSGRPRPQRWRYDRMRDNLDDYRIPWQIDGGSCEVYLFQRWGGYSHPVLPLEPLTPGEALRTSFFSRAYVCEINGEPLMVRFASFIAHDSEFPIPERMTPGLYRAESSSDGRVAPGEMLDSRAAAMADQLIIVGEPPQGGLPTAILRRLTWVRNFDYEYDDTGLTLNVHISSERGNKTVRISSPR